MNASIQAIEAKYFGKEYETKGIKQWSAQTNDLLISRDKLSFSFSYEDSNARSVFKISAKSKEGFLYSGSVYRNNVDYLDVGLNYFTNGKHHLLICLWNEDGVEYHVYIEGHEL